MNLATILAMAADGFGDRTAIGSRRGGGAVTYRELLERGPQSRRGDRPLRARRRLHRDGRHGLRGVVLRQRPRRRSLRPAQLPPQRGGIGELIARHPGALRHRRRRVGSGVRSFDGVSVNADSFAGSSEDDGAGADTEPVEEPAGPLLILYTSGTTAEPKGALLRHDHLTSYLLGTVEFGNAEAEEAALVSVPPYHIAGVANLVSNVYFGKARRLPAGVHPQAWLETVRQEHITQAMVVPTMLARIVESLSGAAGTPPTNGTPPPLRRLVYGGAPMPAPVIEQALRPLSDDRVRQRLRPHRDELDDRRPRSR